ncbi:serine hydrolase domain-containing protein [Thalassotalea mangrovi]|uniref:Beta-lactamase family protein n=1 Tax=Thalassotalea mangrovi TaxID=2572245 RepID=A0A4V5NU82_9GAMM|nr:serine hydrolase domain-containing protein [Thalassotalea mangrovi]TKB45315.1 beta-lactamase family protein [Thalassotalea mangrovi]
MIRVLTSSPEFQRVTQTFAEHFNRDDEFQDVGASFSVYQHGVKRLELIGGLQQDNADIPWQPQTLTNVWSTSKGIIAIAIAQLVDSGELNYQLPVRHWWPEFAANGKAEITLAQLLSHQAGLNGFKEPTSPDDLYDWSLITQRLAQQAPLWSPGSTASYHGMTFGWLAGEIIRRSTGLMPADYIRTQIAEPLAADLHIGLPVPRKPNVALIIPPEPDKQPIYLNDIARHTIQNPVPDALLANCDAWQQAQIPAVNIHATADALAKVYAATISNDRKKALFRKSTLQQMTTAYNAGKDEMLGDRYWGAGVALNSNGLYGPNRGAFGHSGWGGSFACADPQSGISMAYITRRMGSALNGDPRAQNLIKAVYEDIMPGFNPSHSPVK